MTCDEVREQLAEHLLGTLEEPADVEVRRHLRSCAGCRGEMAALEDGVETFARAAHESEPPQNLRERVLTVLREEWDEAPTVAPFARRSVARFAWAAAAVLAILGSVWWGAAANGRANRYEVAATKYETFLKVLGGENVRLGNLDPAGPQEVKGSVVLYDSKVGQSWVLILARAPGVRGEAKVTLSSPDGSTIELHPMGFADGGEASTWLVTSADLKPFDRVTITGPDGQTLATAIVSGDLLPE